jgi:cyanate permease
VKYHKPEIEEYPKQKRSKTNEKIEPYQTRYRWMMLALVSLLYWVFGIVTRSLPPLITPILEDLKITYSQMGMILGSWQLTYIGVAAVGGAIIDRWGIRKSLFVGILIIGISEALRSLSGGFFTMYFFVALFGLGGPMISIGCPKVISTWFRGKERGTAVGVYTAMSWIGGFTAFSTANSIVMPLTGNSWRLTFVFYSLLAFAAAVLWYFLARETTLAEEAAERNSVVQVFTGLVKVRRVRAILLMGFLSFAASHGFSSWFPKILESRGIPPSTAGFIASFPLLIGIPMLLLVSRWVAPSLRGRVIVLISLGFSIAVLIVAGTQPGKLFITGLLLYGLTLGPVFPLLMLILMDIPQVSSKYMGSAGGMFFCVAEIGGFAGPFIVGAVKDLTGSFFIGAAVVAGLSTLIAIMGLTLKDQPANH